MRGLFFVEILWQVGAAQGKMLLDTNALPARLHVTGPAKPGGHLFPAASVGVNENQRYQLSCFVL
jgi:hypothetical protein